MPTYHKRKKRKNGYKRYGKFVGAAGKTAYLALQVFKLKKMINVEYKNLYRTLGDSPTDTSKAFFNLTNCPQGNGENERQGNQIKVTQIYFNSLIKINPSAVNTQVRYIIFRDMQSNGVIPAIGDLLNNSSDPQSLISPLNLTNKYRFQIMYNKLVRISSDFPSTQIKFFKRMDIKVRYADGVNTSANISTNSMWLLVFSNEDLLIAPTITHSVRISYVDN